MLDNEQQRFEQAREYIRAKDFDRARDILQTIDHPKAREWLDRIADIQYQAEFAPTQAWIQPRVSRNWKIAFALMAVAFVLLAILVIVLRNNLVSSLQTVGEVILEETMPMEVLLRIACEERGVDDATCRAYIDRVEGVYDDEVRGCLVSIESPSANDRFIRCLQAEGVPLP